MIKTSRGTRSIQDGPPAVQPPPVPRVPLDACPHCAGPLVTIPGNPAEFKARCTWCGDLWRSTNLLTWKRDRIPLRYKLALVALLVLFLLAALVDGTL